jgi:hypothetical protein
VEAREGCYDTMVVMAFISIPGTIAKSMELFELSLILGNVALLLPLFYCTYAANSLNLA